MWHGLALAKADSGVGSELRQCGRGSDTGAQRASGAMGRYASAGHDGDFAQVHALLAPRLYRLCVALGGHDEAEDLLQEVLLKLHRFRDRFRQGANVMVWAYAIARTTAIDRKRRMGRRAAEATDPAQFERYLGVEVPCPEAAMMGQELEDLVYTQLSELSEQTRAAYQLVKLDGLSVAEAGEQLGISGAAVRQRVHRANVVVRERLDHAGWSRS